MKKAFMNQAGWSGEAWQEVQRKAFAEATKQAAVVANLYLSGIGIASEGADLVLTVHELSQGNTAAIAGLLPLIPVTGAIILRGPLDELAASGNAIKLDNGLTRAAHALDKHGNMMRGKSTNFPTPRGGVTAKNNLAQEVLEDILTAPNSRVGDLPGGNFKDGGFRIIAPDGRFAAFDKNGTFQYFGEE